MQHLRNAILVVVVVLMTAAGITGTASAAVTRLCGTDTTPCTGTTDHASITETNAPGTTSSITTSGSPVGINPTITCSDSHKTITTTTDTSGSDIKLFIKINLNFLVPLFFGGCTSTGPTGCSSSASSSSGITGEITWTAGMNGTTRETIPAFTFTCPILGAPVSCTFGGSGTVDGTFTGGNPAKIDYVNQALPSTGGFGCPTNATWNVLFTTSTALYITSG